MGRGKSDKNPEGLPRSITIQTNQGQILRRNFSYLHKTQADITSNRVVVPETKYTEEPAVQQAPAQAQSPAVLKLNLPQQPTVPRTRSGRIINQSIDFIFNSVVNLYKKSKM